MITHADHRIEQYARNARVTASPIINRFGGRTLTDILMHLRLSNGALGLVDESIEAYEVAHNSYYKSATAPGILGTLPPELGDVFWYLAHICDTLNIKLATILPSNHDWTAIQRSIPFHYSTQVKHLLEHTGELLAAAKNVGELVKKYSYHGHEFNEKKFTDALIQVGVELFILCYLASSDPYFIMEQNIAKLAARYPDKFAVERSEVRDSE